MDSAATGFPVAGSVTGASGVEDGSTPPRFGVSPADFAAGVLSVFTDSCAALIKDADAVPAEMGEDVALEAGAAGDSGGVIDVVLTEWDGSVTSYTKPVK